MKHQHYFASAFTTLRFATIYSLSVSPFLQFRFVSSSNAFASFIRSLLSLRRWILRTETEIVGNNSTIHIFHFSRSVAALLRVCWRCYCFCCYFCQLLSLQIFVSLRRGTIITLVPLVSVTFSFFFLLSHDARYLKLYNNSDSKKIQVCGGSSKIIIIKVIIMYISSLLSLAPPSIHRLPSPRFCGLFYLSLTQYIESWTLFFVVVVVKCVCGTGYCWCCWCSRFSILQQCSMGRLRVLLTVNKMVEVTRMAAKLPITYSKIIIIIKLLSKLCVCVSHRGKGRMWRKNEDVRTRTQSRPVAWNANEVIFRHCKSSPFCQFHSDALSHSCSSLTSSFPSHFNSL